MSAETLEKAIDRKPAEALLSKRRKKLVTDPLVDENPITIQVLGICSALAVTTQMKPTLVMAISVIFVIVMSNLAISLLRNTIPTRVRIIVQLAVVATLVTLVSEVLKAFAYDMYKELSVFVGLIITNCIVMGRLEAYAMANKPWQSFLDGIGNGLGYGFILVLMAIVREFFGKGSFMGWRLMPDAYIANNLMVLPCASLFIIGIVIWIQRGANRKLIDIS
jgi:Na+-transporting NADH:ubiquinone oxidoreductase subunit D